jgi:nucleoid-associated protein YgaU
MPPRKLSRHSYVLGIADEGEPDAIQLTERTPYGYRPLADTRQHVVKQGDTLWSLATRYFVGFSRPAGLWWVIADFQPDPILDPTIALSPGTVLYIPSVRTVLENIFSETRRTEPES